MSRFLRSSLLLGIVFATMAALLSERHASPAPGFRSQRSRSRVRSSGVPEGARSAPEVPSPAPPGGARADSLEDRAEREPAAAWRWAVARLPADDASWQPVLSLIAQNDPGRAAGYATQLAHDRPELAQIAHAIVLDMLAQDGNYTGARGVLEQLPEGEMKSHLVTNLTLPWARDDPLAAAEWLAGLSAELDRPTAFARLGQAWADAQPQEAAEMLVRLPAGDLRRSSLTAALSSWMDSNPLAASAWMEQLEPHPDLDPAVARLARSPRLVPARVAVALGWAERVVDANERLQTLDSIIVRWADTDRTAAVHYIRDSAALSAAQRATLLEDVGSDRPAF